jgi:ligand-binding sensor domain-containing protein/signal transduction histidine kinase/DNA-binding response OmpR family regulator
MNQIRTYLLIASVVFGFHLHGMTFRKHDMSNGLSHNSAICLTQTKDGYIWIGTRDGLCRFDGITYKIYKKDFDNVKSISNNSINCLFEDSKGFLWVGTTMGLNRYAPEKDEFENFFVQNDGAGMSHNYIRAVNETSDGKILIGSPGGVDIFDPITRTFTKARSRQKEAAEKSVFCFMRDRKNQIWVGTRNGVYQLKQDSLFESVTLRMGKPDIVNKEIRDIEEDKDGKIWIATEGSGLFSVSFENGKMVRMDQFNTENSSIGSDYIRKISIKNNEIWIGTLEGLSVLNPISRAISNYRYSATDPQGLSNNSIRDILHDSQDGVWVATYAGGVNYYHLQNNLFPHFKITNLTGNSHYTNVVSGFMEESNGNLWIASEGSGLFYSDYQTTKILNFSASLKTNSLINNNIKTIIKDGEGNLWIGTYGGLSFFNRKTNLFTNFKNIPGNVNSLINNQVHALFLDGNNRLWIGTNGGGIQLYNPVSREFRQIVVQGVKNVNVFMPDAKGNLWIGHQAGLACMDISRQESVELAHYNKQLPVSMQYVQSLFLDKSGRIWAGTQGYGLFMLEGEKITWFTTSQGLPDNTINAAVEDNNGNIWISTNKGISRVSLVQNGSGKDLLKTKTYSTNQGLQELQFLPGSVLKSENGEILFGGVNGFNRFDPANITDTDYFPELKIRTFSAGSNKNDSLTYWPVHLYENGNKVIQLHYQSRNITIGFWGINYIDPGNTFYRYKLTGINDDWVSPGTEREVTFSYLPVGHYRFQVQTSTHPAIWNSDFKSLTFTILPPWWQTRWAFAGYFAVLGLLLLLFFQLSKRWINLNNQLKMEHFQREKEEELHQMKQKFFTDISHELRTPLTLISAPLEQMSKQTSSDSPLYNLVVLIRQNVIRMTKLITNFLDLQKLDAGSYKLKTSKDDLAKFINDTGRTFGEIARLKNIDFRVVSEFESLEIYFDREKIEIILFNLLSNALKNTPEGGRIILGLKSESKGSVLRSKGQEEGDFVSITVWDNGKGIAPAIRERIFERFFVYDARGKESSLGSGIGLEFTKRLVELHKGKIFVESLEKTVENEGFSQFSVLLPFGKKHLLPGEIAEDGNIQESGSKLGSVVTDNIKTELLLPHIRNEWNRSDISPSENVNLLIVEDNLEMREFVKSLFTSIYQVEVADNGKSGLEKAFEVIPDLIICDIMMPEMNGIEFCKKIKKDIRTSHIPVILLTARAEDTVQLEGLETGADDFIIKPFSADNLQLRVRNLLRRQELIRAQINLEFISEPLKISITSADEKLLRKAVEFISQHMSDTSLNVERLSAELGLSRVHLYRKIKALTNLTAIEFIRSIKLKRAESLLRENKLNVSEISNLVGFEDIDYFRSCFKLQYGVSPTEYVRNTKT